MERMRIAAALVITAWFAGCGEEPEQTARDTSASEAEARTASAPSPAPAPAPASGAEVLETMNAAGYTYARLRRGGEEKWYAGPETELEVGDRVAVGEGMLQEDFPSRALDRTFDEIWFVGSWGRTSPAEPVAEKPDEKAGEPAAGTVSIESVYAEKESLDGQTVAVSGEVVKVNPAIMGRNWIHLQDGTGSAGTNDITVTTQAEVSVGDVVVARGTVAVDKDFGAGYRYDVIIENATVEPK